MHRRRTPKEEAERFLYFYEVYTRYVHDGDTVTDYDLYYGFGLKKVRFRGQSPRLRSYGINAAEKYTGLKAKEATIFKKTALEGHKTVVSSVLDRSGMYGGFLFEWFVTPERLKEACKAIGYPVPSYETQFGLINLNEIMVKMGLAVEFMKN